MNKLSAIAYTNCALLVAIGLVVFSLIFVKRHRVDETILPPPQIVKKGLPPSGFERSFTPTAKGFFALNFVAPEPKLPNLSSEIIFYGLNQRPDIPKDKPLYKIGLKNSTDIKNILPCERVYLVYDRFTDSSPSPSVATKRGALWDEPAHRFSKGRFLFSPNNEKSPLWIELKPLNNQRRQVHVHVNLVNEQGNFITTPEKLCSFALNEMPSHHNRFSFDLDGKRVDSTLLVRQRARWCGRDLFLAQHGGDEFSEAKTKERLDFVSEKNSYTLFVTEQDTLIWKEGIWQAAKQTTGYPLLFVKKVEERTMTFEAWAPNGEGMVTLTLLRSKQGTPLPPLNHIFRFVGAKTWAQFLLECQGERKIVRAGDWLLFYEGKWVNLQTTQQIDDYVNQVTQGPLFVIDAMEKQQGKQVLVGHLFSTSRTEVQKVELPAESSFFAKPTPHALPPRFSGKNMATKSGAAFLPPPSEDER